MEKLKEQNGISPNDGKTGTSSNKSSTVAGKLVVFWYTGSTFVGPSAALNDPRVETYGNFMQLPDDHFEIWDQYNTVGPDAEYNFWPRGRILFKVTIHKFVVIGDKRIIENETVRQKLLDHYNLPPTTIFETDEHYQ